MGTQKKWTITEETIVESYVPVGEYRKYFQKALGEDCTENFDNFQNWLNASAGRTVKKATEAYHKEMDLSGGNKLVGLVEEDMSTLLKEDRFAYISKENKKFIAEFTKRMKAAGYDFGGQIGGGFCWGQNMIIYSQTGGKTEKVVARIYVRDNGVIVWGGTEYRYKNSIVLRLFFDNINKHTEYVEKAPAHINALFSSGEGTCPYICGQRSEKCHNQKRYALNGKQMEKCGYYFCFTDPKPEAIKDYVDILQEFHAKKTRA
jgi:hypothetical protein